MSNHTERVAILGGTGLVGRRLASLLINHPSFELAMVIGSDSSAGMSYRQVWAQKERALRNHYGEFWREDPFPPQLDTVQVSNLDQLLRSDCSLIFSTVHERYGYLEEQLRKDGRTIFSNSPYKRFHDDVALIVPEVNGEILHGKRFIKYPNCVSSGLVLVLAPLKQHYGLREVVITTYQSLSGRGDAKYPAHLVVGNVYPLHASPEATEEYIRKELCAVLRTSCPTSACCNRVYTQEGHLVEVGVKTERRIDRVEDVRDILASFDPLKSCELHSSFTPPLFLVTESGRPRTAQDSQHSKGMAVAVGNLSIDDEIFDLRLTYVINNLIRGAAGGILLCAELWKHQKKTEAVNATACVGG